MVVIRKVVTILDLVRAGLYYKHFANTPVKLPDGDMDSTSKKSFGDGMGF